jgi:hypothetical protein
MSWIDYIVGIAAAIPACAIAIWLLLVRQEMKQEHKKKLE